MKAKSFGKNTSLILVSIIIALLFSSVSPFVIGQSHVSGAEGKLHQGSLIPSASSLNVQNVSAFSVNPYEYVQKEPAPMGITDFGYSSGTGPYEYNSTSFVGVARIGSLYTYNQSLKQGTQNSSAFQLNLNLQFTYGSNTYTYWVQDVAVLYSSKSGTSQHVVFIDNVWNFSSPNAMMYSSSLTGNGTVSTVSTRQGTISYYYYQAYKQTGNNITMHTPASLKLKAVSYIKGGVPEVAMKYSDGSGWVTYDNIYFNFARNNVKDRGFVVNGYSYNPQGLFYDSEFIIGGPGGGSSTVFQTGSVNLSLQYWNGHNYQNVPNAYNFGSDTGESISNVGSSFIGAVMNASLYSHMYASSGSLKQIYSLSSLGVVNVTLPFYSGTAKVNGRVLNYTDYGLNLTLYPGTYNISISSPSSPSPLNGSFIILAGQHLSLNRSSFGPQYTLHIREKGLSHGTPWTVRFTDGLSLSSNQSVINVTLSNGQYAIYTNSTSGYLADNGTIIAVVDGSNTSAYANFSRLYSVNFYEKGLTGIMWAASMNGNKSFSTSRNITFKEVNGTYNYSVMHLRGYVVSPAQGVVSVNGSSVNVTVLFTPVTYRIVIHERGLPAGITWYIQLPGKTYYSNSTTLTVQLANGTYAFEASSQTGTYSLAGNNNTIFVNGADSNVSIKLTSVYNSGDYLYTKMEFIGLMTAIGIAGAIVARRR